MSRNALIALTAVFGLTALAVSFTGDAVAGLDSLSSQASATAADVVRCSLQPHHVTLPESGTRVLVLRNVC